MQTKLMHALPSRTKVMLLQLLWLQVLMQLAASGMVTSLRDLLREEESLHNHAASERRSRRRLVDEPMVVPCGSDGCQVDLTTGVAQWVGAAALLRKPSWAQVHHGSWIGSPHPARQLVVASVSFEVTEPACASFELSFAIDGRVLSAELNGRPLQVPPHGYRQTTEDAGSEGLVAQRGQAAFALGTNSLVLSVARGAGDIGLYVSGAVQLLCPLDEALISMHPTSGPAAGATPVVLTSTVHIYTENWIRCRVSGSVVDALVIDASTIRCVTPPLRHRLRGWAQFEIVTPLQGTVAVGAQYLGQSLSSSFYYHGELTIFNVAPASGPTQGGTFVALHGRFDHLGTLRCRFEIDIIIQVVPRVIDAFHIECTSPPRASPGESMVRVTGNGIQYSHPGATFTYHDPLSILALKPAKLKSEGGTTITVRIDREWSQLSTAYRFCKFGSVLSAASMTANDVLACITPAHHPDFVVVEITMNGMDYTSSGKQVQYVQVALLALHPTSGPVLGNTTIALFGVHLFSGLSCVFDGQHATVAYSRGREQLHCITPRLLRRGWVSVQLKDANNTLETSSMVHVDEDVAVHLVTPPLGPEVGGTRVDIVGQGFRDAQTLRCGFELSRTSALKGESQRSVTARYVGEALIQCFTPSGRTSGVAKVAVSINGQQYAAGGARYTYQPAAAVSHVSPSAAPSEGGTPLTVHGGGFSAASEALGVLVCRVGGAVRRAAWASASALVCNATRAPAGAARLEVSNNAREYAAGGVRLRLVSVRVLDVQPWSGPSGGATVVSVRARGAWPGGLRCRFGEGVASAGWGGGAARLRCVAPPSGGGASGWVGVQLASFHGALASGGSFYYHAPLGASGVAPPVGPERGGTRVAVLGGGFRDAYTLRCAFGGAPAAAPVLARYVDESQLECASPVHAPGGAPVLLSMNGQQYAAGGARYTYQPAAAVSHVSPSAALSEGGTPLTVHGGGFSAASEALGLLVCRIGNLLSRASWLSIGAILCFTARSAPGFVSLSVSNNARDFLPTALASSSASVEFVTLHLLDVHPFSGPLDGSTAVTLAGSGLHLSGLGCKFGDHPPVALDRISPYRALCVSPPHSVTGWVVLQLQSYAGTADSAAAFFYRSTLSLSDSPSEALANSATGPAGASRLSPALGPIRGGTVVSVIGTRTESMAASSSNTACTCRVLEMCNGRSKLSKFRGPKLPIWAITLHSRRAVFDITNNRVCSSSATRRICAIIAFA